MKPCECPKCLPAIRREDNIDRAYAVEVAVICMKCGSAVTKNVGIVLRARGRALCDRCDGRKK